MLILLNNKFVSPKNAKVSVLSDAFMYGFGVFETLRTYGDKKVFKIEEHVDRLFNSAAYLNLKIKHSKTEITKMLRKIVEKSPYKEQRIKIMATGELTIIISKKLEIEKGIYKGVPCVTARLVRFLPEAKTLAYLDSFISHRKAVEKGCYEAILIDENGKVFEGAYSNIFWFEGENLCTRRDKILQGITRQTVIEKSPFKVKFKTISIKELLKRKEIFLTQTTTGIVPVTKINGKKIGDGSVGESTRRLMRMFSRGNF